MLLVMLGLPIAPVVCDLACPQAPLATSPASRAVTVASTGTAPCHESAGSGTAAPHRAAPTTTTVATAASLASSPMHGCDHPVVVASRATSEGFRLYAPAVALETSLHVGTGQPSPARAERRPFARAPSPPPTGAFSPILRI